MKTQKRPDASVKHHEEVKRIGSSKECPQASSDFLAWLKIQNQKLEYRLLYCDLVVCICFVILVFTTMRFQATVMPNRWFLALLMSALIAGCILFIGVHLLQHREAHLKAQAKHTVINWNSYRLHMQRWPVIFGAYSIALLVLGCMHYLNANTAGTSTTTCLLITTVILFILGMFMLIKTIRAKESTHIYVLQANPRRVKPRID